MVRATRIDRDFTFFSPVVVARRALGASRWHARASVGLDSRDRARGLLRRASPRARADARVSARGSRRCAVEFSWRRSVRCGRETRRRARWCGRGSAIVDCGGVNGSRIRNTAWGCWPSCDRGLARARGLSDGMKIARVCGRWVRGVGRRRRRGLSELRASVALKAVAPTRELLTFCAY